MLKLSRLAFKLLLIKTDATSEHQSSLNIKSCVKDYLTVKLKDIIKDADIKNCIFSEAEKLKYKKHSGVKTLNLPFTFPETNCVWRKIPQNPFILVPVFEIVHPNSDSLRQFFKENTKLNRIIKIYENDTKTNKIYAFAQSGSVDVVKSVKLRRVEIYLDPNDDRPNKSSFFIFDNSKRKSVMLYVGALLQCPSDWSFATDLYTGCLLNKTETSLFEGIYFKLIINIRDLIKGIYIFSKDKLSEDSFQVKLSLTGLKDEKANQTLIIKLSREIQHKEICLRIDKYIGDTVVNDMVVTCEGVGVKTKVFLGDFKQQQYQSENKEIFV
ncbi:hypothetical protein CDIK_2303 [Cucumispora dikerogammari]|nr:hypothetical protein CDIK_2303 [Cucumispora dikerogammari]